MQQWHEHLGNYDNELKNRELSRISRRAYMSRLNSFIQFLDFREISYERLADEHLAMEMLQRYAESLQRQGGSEASVYSQVRTVSNFLAFSGMHTTVDVTCPKQTAPARDVPTLTLEEETRFVASLAKVTTKERALALTFLCAGLRPSECAELRVSNITFVSSDYCLIHIAQGKPRTISAGKELAKALDALIKERYACDPDFVFLNKDGNSMSIQGMDYLVRRIGQRMRLFVSPSILRKTFLYRLLGQGNDREVVAFLTGYRAEHVCKIKGEPEREQAAVAIPTQHQQQTTALNFAPATAQPVSSQLWGK